MANTFTQIYIQIVFSVKNRGCVIPKSKKRGVAQIYYRYSGK